MLFDSLDDIRTFCRDLPAGDRRFAEAYFNWGVLLVESMGKPAEACEKYAMAVEINPRFAEAYFNWGNALQTMGKPAEACEEYAKTVEINP